MSQRARIVKTPVGYKVPSQSTNAFYNVIPVNNRVVCDCPDFETREKPCKHIYAVKFLIVEDTAIPEESQVEAETYRVTYRRNWNAYNNAQFNEQEMFGRLLRELCDTVHTPVQRGRGRPRLPLSDMVFAIGTKVYSTMSGRRAMTDVRNAKANGQLDSSPSFTSITRYLAKPELTPILKYLVEQSAVTLNGVETKFAADSSGFSTKTYTRWVDKKWGRERKKAKWIKAHIMCGVRTNIVTALEVVETEAHDSKFFKPLVETTARSFDVKEVSADKAYLSKANFHIVDEVGGIPYIPFKTNSLPEPIVGKKDSLWARLYDLYHLERTSSIGITTSGVTSRPPSP